MRVLKQRKNAKVRNKVRHQINRERLKMRIAKGDTVKVMRGEDKGHVGEVLRVLPKTGRIVVKGANVVKRHRKARRPEEQSGIITMEAPIHVSNVMLVDPKSGDATRVRTRIDEDGTKERIAVKSGEAIARNR
jgi:large subunit ribosomal protein L24